MIPFIPSYITLIVIVNQILVAAAVWHLLAGAAARSGLPPEAQRRIRSGSGLFLATWLTGALLSAPAPASLLGRDPFRLTPVIPLFVALPFAVVAGVLWRSAAARRALAATPLPALVGVQAVENAQLDQQVKGPKDGRPPHPPGPELIVQLTGVELPIPVEHRLDDRATRVGLTEAPLGKLA